MVIWIGLGLWNLVVFSIYALDKLRAKKGWRRTPEKTLLWLAAALGGPGALAAMHTVHHKTRKPRFAWGVPAMTAVQVVAFGWGKSRGWW